MVTGNPAVDSVRSVHSGKFRRYHGEGFKQILDIVTLFKNIRDFFLFCCGLVESVLLLHKEKPDVILVKGGFVGVPVGLAAAALRLPYVTHDSDAVPGLANRLISRWASAHAVAMPVDIYKYPAAKTTQVGVPIAGSYKPVTPALRAEYKRALGLDPKNPVLLVTGGGLGAQRLNEAVAKISKLLLARQSRLHILHIAGRGKVENLQALYKQSLGPKTAQVTVVDFVEDGYKYSGAADVIVARAGATALAEFAAQAKACIVVPNQQLTGGHQVKNAHVLESAGAIVTVSDVSVQKNPELLLQPIEQLLEDPNKRHKLAVKLHTLAQADSARLLANLVLSSAKMEPQ